MCKLRANLPVMLLWAATLLAAYLYGSYGNGTREQLPVTGSGATAVASEPEPDRPENIHRDPVGIEPEVAEAVSARMILAEAREELRSGLLSQKGVLRAFNCIQSLDADTVIDAVSELEGLDSRHPDHEVLILAVMGRWAELDGDSAMNYAEGELSGDLRAGVIVNVAGSWSESNPEQALKWYQRRHLTGQLDSWLGSSAPKLLTPIYLGLARSDPEEAFSLMVAIEDEEGFACAVEGMAAAIVGLGRSEQMLRRSGEISATRQEVARTRVLKHWARSAPADAAAWLLQMNSSAERSRLMRQVGMAWVRHDPESALDWLLEHSSNTARADILRESIALWAQAKPNQAATWLRRLKPGNDTDQAIATLAQQIVHRDPEGAFSWASTIQNRVMREQTVASVFAQWAIRHPQAAAARLNETDFPAEQVSKLRLLVAPNLPKQSP
ncbi:MAG: hypothetical protein GY899_17430 [Verrucomicrobiaceae bacterium]|nr:hypothetical protein [Verrucomicrobiaceae bacterium]